MQLHRILADRFVTLEPVVEAHREGLRAACDADQDVWERLYPYSMAGEHFDPAFARMLEGLEQGNRLSFAVVAAGRIVGTTSYLAPSETDRSVEIGASYYQPDSRGGAVNPACKRLLLAHAFDHGITRVQFKVDAINSRSRAAVAKLGAVFEGILRQDRVVWTGRVRDTSVYSILAGEWPAVRERLDARLAALEAA
jgi:RimJ/RimL family protein N-acetyltransferase